MAVRTVLVGFEQDAGLVERIKAVLRDGDAKVIVAGTDEELEAAVDKADVLFGGILRPDLVEKAGRLKWFQTNSAGVENVASPELADSRITVTNMSGAHATQISEHALAMMLAFARDLPRAIRAQDSGDWLGFDMKTFELDGSVLAIAGLGDLGGALADKAKALGMVVLATKMRVTTKPVSVDEIYGPEGLDEIIGRADFVADTLPLTPRLCTRSIPPDEALGLFLQRGARRNGQSGRPDRRPRVGRNRRRGPRRYRARAAASGVAALEHAQRDTYVPLVRHLAQRHGASLSDFPG